MDNHFHLLFKGGKESLSTSLKKIATSYVYYYQSFKVSQRIERMFLKIGIQIDRI